MTPSYRASILVLTVLLSGFITSAHTQFTSGSAAQAPPPLTEEQKRKTVEALESSLLALFGLSRRPRPSKDVVIPQYMIDLYRIQSGDTDTHIPNVFTRSQAAKPANTIRSFFHEGNFIFVCQEQGLLIERPCQEVVILRILSSTKTLNDQQSGCRRGHTKMHLLNNCY